MFVAAIRLPEYVDSRGRSAHEKWFNSLPPVAAAKVAAALHQLEAGNSSNVKGVGSGVFERKIDFGPGYRIYFGRDSDTLLILLGGSSKQRQQKAIVRAKTLWSDYRRRKR